ncbi:Cof-type HAD-IIB family hydrolase [Scytonema sp. UIC 10036]|uniref:Cof-type HAD-IIB family hydrolase n=1 Tax=Scytonema sp. UIC 10036 TaxID=2304196 RepID=UPI0012DA33AC|nr:Cof-type HAD-IIB family hydrolase [Scytonema sp. UIC 10036]MUG96068.1 Cof-type HAD-IIB family hydrolase [Scytonema sp. UIC 10036]
MTIISNKNTSSIPPKVSLLVADVDGTLVTKQKVLTERARNAVRKLYAADIAFTITSGRPPRGMKTLIDDLALTAPIAAFNGAVFLRPDLSIVEQNLLNASIAKRVVEIIDSHGLDVWLYSDRDWFVRDRHAPHVDREEWTIKFPPIVVPTFNNLLDNVAKIVGVSDDLEAVARCEADTQREFRDRVCCEAGASSGGSDQVSAARSQPYYLDVTHPRANKGFVVERLSQMLAIPTQEIATIGDMPNDVPMFSKSGLSIAMGNASLDVQHAAKYVTTSNEDEGFANAVERYILGSQISAHTSGELYQMGETR